MNFFVLFFLLHISSLSSLSVDNAGREDGVDGKVVFHFLLDPQPKYSPSMALCEETVSCLPLKQNKLHWGGGGGNALHAFHLLFNFSNRLLT